MKRSFKAQIRYAKKKILEEDKEFYNEVKAQYYPEKEAHSKKRLLLKVGAVAACFLLIGICLSVILVNTLKNEPSEYLLENEVVENINIYDLQKSVLWFPIDESSDSEYHITRIYDSLSGDNLYFEVRIEGNTFAEKVKINIYTNPKYKNKHILSGNDIVTKEINNISVQYTENISNKGLYTFNYTAQFTKEKADVYIEYNQVWYENNTHFFKFLEEII